MFLYTKTGEQDFPDGSLVQCVCLIDGEAGGHYYPVGTIMRVSGHHLVKPEDEDEEETETYGGIFANWELFEINQPLEELL